LSDPIDDEHRPAIIYHPIFEDMLFAAETFRWIDDLTATDRNTVARVLPVNRVAASGRAA
jgi:hypothetical protein